MGDEDDRIPLRFQVLQLDEELRGFLGGQHRRGFIHDQDLCAADQRLQDFHLLLHADGNIHHFCFRFHKEVEPFGVFLRKLDCLRPVDEHARFLRNHSEHHVFRHGKARDQHKMLMDHADPMGDGHGRGGQLQRFPVHNNCSACRLLKPEEHFHQGALSGTVFSHEGMDFTLSKVKIHFPVCCGAVRIHLSDLFHPNNILFCREFFFIRHA